MGSGETRITAKVQPRTGSADVDLTAQIERVDMASMKDLVRAYGGVDVAAGEFSMYSELRMKDGALSGYVKPLFRGVKVGGDGEGAQEKSLRRRLYEGLVNIAGKILKNRARGEVATVVTLGGRVDQPQFSQWQVVGRLLQNAFIRAILPGYEEPKPPKAEQAAPAHQIEHRQQRPPDPGPPASKEGP